MEVIEAEFEIRRISKPISLPFEGLDFIDEALHCSAGDVVLEVAEKSSPVGSKCLADPYERFDTGGHGVFAPHGEELLALLAIILFPEQSELFFHGVDYEKRAVHLEQGVEPVFALRSQGIVILQQQKTTSF